ncbi:MAG: Na(+)/H(+) antiporter subunit C [Bacillota bacterium]
MELLSALVIGLLFAVGTYLLLAKNMIRVVLGNALISYGTNIMILTAGRLKTGRAPVLGGHDAHGEAIQYIDPVPQALILTAIVIGFAVTAFIFVLAYRTVQEYGTDNLAELRGMEDE